jgi:hypothetical protein
MAYQDLGDSNKAMESYKEAYQIALDVWGKDNVSTLAIQKNLEDIQSKTQQISRKRKWGIFAE